MLLLLLTFVVGVISQHDTMDMLDCSSYTFDPILSVADFNGDGSVTVDDITDITQRLTSEGDIYRSIYDRDGDLDVDGNDIALAAQDLGKSATALDQELTYLFHLAEPLLEAGPMTPLEWYQRGFVDNGVFMQYHGDHLVSFQGLAVYSGSSPNIREIHGVNMDDDGSIVGLYHFQPQRYSLLFDPDENGNLTPLDRDTCDIDPLNPVESGSCEWHLYPVVAFEHEADKLFSSDCKQNHAHEGLCIYQQADGTPRFDQSLSHFECLNETYNTPQGVNPHPPWEGLAPVISWVNMYMNHEWLQKPNPDGVFANVHKCVSINSPPESGIGSRAFEQYDRERPSFFQHSHHEEPCPLY